MLVLVIGRGLGLVELGLAGLLLAPPAEPSVPTEPAPSEPAPSEQALAKSTTHGLAEIRIRVRGRRDPVVGAELVALLPDREDPSGAAELIPITDADGRTRVWLSPGTHEFVVVAEGFERLEVAIEIAIGERQTIELRLDESIAGSGRYRTVVTTERAVAVTSTRLRDAEIREVPGSGGDPFAVVRSLPGASQVAGFLPYVVIRGAAPGNTGYYLDGVRVPSLFHVAAGPSVIHPYFIDEVDFYPSGVPVRLGRFASGIIEGRTRPAGRDRVRGEVDLRLTDVGGLVEVPFRKRNSVRPARGSLAVAGRYSYTGLILSAIPALNVKLRYWDYQVRLDHDLGSRARYTALVFGSYDELGQREALVSTIDENGIETQSIDRDPDPFIRLEFHRINQVVRQRVGTRGGTGHVEYRLGLGLDRSGVATVRIDEWRVTPRIDARLPVSDNLEIGLGLDQDVQIFEVPGELDLSDTATEDLAIFLAERVISVTGVYLDFAWQKGWFEVRPGVRADLWVQAGPSPYLPQARAVTAAIGLDPRITLRERVADRWTLRQSLGVYHQAPDPPLPIPGIEAIGLDQGLQRNIQGTFGWEWQMGEIASLTQDVYLGRLSNLQDYELSGSAGETEFDDFLIRVSGWSYGLETMLRLLPGQRAWGWLAYTLSRSTRNYPIGGSAPSAWDQRHILNVVLGWNVSRKWRLGGRLHFNSGRPYTTQRTLADGTIESFIDAARDHRNDARLPSFLQFDFRVERIFTLRDFRLHLYLDLTNATLSREVLRCDPSVDVESGAAVVDGCVNPQALRYVLPTLGLRGVF